MNIDNNDKSQIRRLYFLNYHTNSHIDVHSQILMIFGMGCVYNDKKDSLQDVKLHKDVRQ